MDKPDTVHISVYLNKPDTVYVSVYTTKPDTGFVRFSYYSVRVLSLFDGYFLALTSHFQFTLR